MRTIVSHEHFRETACPAPLRAHRQNLFPQSLLLLRLLLHTLCNRCFTLDVNGDQSAQMSFRQLESVTTARTKRSPLSIWIIPLSSLIPLGSHSKVIHMLLAWFRSGDHVVDVVLQGFGFSQDLRMSRQASRISPDKYTRCGLDSIDARSPVVSPTSFWVPGQ